MRPLNEKARFRGPFEVLAVRLLGRYHGNLAAPSTGLELDGSCPGGEDGVVAAEAGSVTGPELRAALADDDLATGHALAGEHLDPEHLGVGVTAVP